MLRSGGAAQPFPAVDMDRVKSAEMPPSAGLWGQAKPNGDAPWSILSHTEHSALDKMRAKGMPLKDWEVSFHRGVLTGYNKAFLIDAEKREQLIASDSRSEEIIKPVLRGRDIHRFRAEWGKLYLINPHNGYGDAPAISIGDYPAVRTHLNEYYPQLEKRHDRGGTPYNLRNCAYYVEFSKQKLIWMDLTEQGRFALDDGSMLCLDTTFFVTGEAIKYLCAVLNSTMATWFIQNTALTSGMGVARWKTFTVERIPIPKLSAAKQRPFVRLVDRILEGKAADPDADTSELEEQIDWLVYNLYGLTEGERAVVGGDVK